MEIIPAILPKDFEEIEEKVSLVRGIAKTVQVDVCDGDFVPTVTWPFDGHYDFAKLLSEEEGMPFWKDVDYEFDLMVNLEDPKKIGDWVQAGASRIIIHAESKGSHAEEINSLEDRVEVGLALGMETDAAVIENYKDKIGFVQLMGIDEIGRQGQGFDPKVIDRVRTVRKSYPHLIISIDGGVTLENAPLLRDAGAGRLVVGSAIFNSEDPVLSLRQFLSL